MKKAFAFLLAVCMLIISAVSLAEESTVSEKRSNRICIESSEYEPGMDLSFRFGCLDVVHC